MTDVQTLADELIDLRGIADPVVATMVGLPGYDDRLPDLSETAQRELRSRAADLVARAEAVDGARGQDMVTARVIAQQAAALVDDIDARLVEHNITDLFVAPAAKLLTLLPMVGVSGPERSAAHLNRLRAIPEFLAAAAQRHRAGVAAGRVPVRHLVNAAIDHLDRYLMDDQADPLLRQEAETESFAAERGHIVADVVRPAFARYRAVLADEIIEHARSADRPGLCALPGGDAAYAALSRMHTTTDRDPDDLHRTGLAVIAELRAEYAELGERVFGTRDQTEVFRRLIEDPAMRWRDADELLDHTKAAMARAEEAAPRWFGRAPSRRCALQEVPDADAPGAPAAYYVWPSLDGLRPGTYFVNTHRVRERDRFLAEVIAFHEAVPGHHFQISLALELEDLPLARRLADFNAYAEGWGLYTERLAEEMGLYSSDVFRLGMLAMDSMRAGRLVVDTGLHAKGWSRDRAVAYLRENTPLSKLEIESEVDRYIGYPGQALSYMVGRLEIQRMRKRAQQRLGDRFDIRGFHDVVLGNGPLPLSVLDDVVTDWTP